MFGSKLRSDRNVPAGDDFVKIDVNSFPVLTLDKERGTKLPPHARTRSHAHAKTKSMVGKIYEILFVCAFFEDSFNRK